MKRFLSIVLASAAIALASVPAEATLTTIGTASYGAGDYNLIHDNDLGLVWLDYRNASNVWQNHVNWAAGLNWNGVLTYNLNPGLTIAWGGDWRLPETNPATPYLLNGNNGSTSGGYNITTSEMGHLFYAELGNTGYHDTNGATHPGWGLGSTGQFSSLRPGIYWSGTEYAPDNHNAWYFNFSDGYQGEVYKGWIQMYGYKNLTYANNNFYAMAVRPGDIVAASVPEPGTMMLMGSGIVGLLVARKRLFRRNG